MSDNQRAVLNPRYIAAEELDSLLIRVYSSNARYYFEWLVLECINDVVKKPVYKLVHPFIEV